MVPFDRLVKVILGKADSLGRVLSDEQWRQMYAIAKRQGMTALCYQGILRLIPEQRPGEQVMEMWTATAQSTRIINETLHSQCAELTKIFENLGFGCCILKGVAYSRYYPDPGLRHCGDLDVWVNGDVVKIVKALRKAGYRTTTPLYHECEAALFKNSGVDVHFRPIKMFNPFYNARLQKFFASCKRECLTEKTTEGYCTPTLRFDLVHCAAHLFRHLIGEGVSCYQLIDCYSILIKSDAQLRAEAYKVLKEAGMGRFCSQLMRVLQIVCSLDEEHMLCPPSDKKEAFLSEIAGKNPGEVLSASERTARHLQYIKEYPGELLWAPISRVWQFFWRFWIKIKLWI